MIGYLVIVELCSTSGERMRRTRTATRELSPSCPSCCSLALQGYSCYELLNTAPSITPEPFNMVLKHP